MKDYYDFEDLEVEEETPAQKRLKKISRFVIGLLLVLMLFSFIIPTNIVLSIIESKQVVNAEIQLEDRKVVFENNAYDRLKEFYLQNQLTEFKVCLTGDIKNNDYIVNSFYVPETFSKTPISVRSVFCDQNTIITLHTHPFKNCLLSTQDIVSFNRFRQINPKAITAVMCDTDRFAFYGI